MSADPQLPFFTSGSLDQWITHLIAVYGYDDVAVEVGRQRPTLTVASAPARSTDPETSHMAAKREQDVGRFSERSRQAKLLYAFSANDLTHQQAAARVVGGGAAPSAFEGCRRRCSDLYAARFIYDTGKRRKNMGSEEESIVWGLSQAGREALESLDATGWSRP
jgi:hypothetical protein